MSDTFYSFAGSFFSKKNHIGLFDYLTLSIPFQISKFAFWCVSNTSNPIAAILLIPTVLIALPLAGVRYGLGALFTLLVSPFVGIAQVISKIQGDPLKNKVKNLQVEENTGKDHQPRPTSTFNKYLKD